MSKVGRGAGPWKDLWVDLWAGAWKDLWKASWVIIYGERFVDHLDGAEVIFTICSTVLFDAFPACRNEFF